MESKKIPIIAIVGPTASGKTKLSIELAIRFLGEIISSDSMQIYKEFNICTAKPSDNDLKAVKHYFINEKSVQDDFSVADYAKAAHIYAKDIYKRGKIPIVVGGTGLYMDSFLKNISFEKDKSGYWTRECLYKYADGNLDKLYQDLKIVDAHAANKIHKNDKKRIIRALEFYYSYGYPISQQTERSLSAESPYKVIFIGINFKDRKILYDRINTRVDNMFEAGLIKEVEEIYKLSPSDTAKAAIGYKEILPYLQGKCDLNEAIENLKRSTRKYAKRQITWFKRNKNINWIYLDEHKIFNEVAKKAIDIVKEQMFYEMD